MTPPASIRSSSRLFADDCVVYREIRSDNDCQILQDYLQKLWDWEKKWGISFHSEKCSILRVHRKRAPIMQLLTQRPYSNMWRVYKVPWGWDFTRYVLETAYRQDREERKQYPLLLTKKPSINSEDVRSAAYISLVRPNLEYCSTIWNPYHKDQIYKLEKVQRRAAWFATNWYHNTISVSEMMDHLNWETLESRRTKAQLTMMFRIVNSLVDVPLEQCLTPASSRQDQLTPASSDRFQPSHLSKRSSFPRTIITWNSLSTAIAESPDLVSFNQGLSTLKYWICSQCQP